MEKRIKGFIYLLVKFIANCAIRGFYRGIDKEGTENIPKQGPFLYAVNHQNAFLDAIIVGALSPVPTYFMTRSDVFKPPFDWFLNALKMMPIYRIRDGYKSLSKNDAIFDTCKGLLDAKQAILIFPEGNHGLDYFLRPLTKGISRIALQAQNELADTIQIIPVGLNYFDHFNSGHKLIVKYGEPIDVNDYLPTYQEHSHKGLLQLTRGIFAGMETTLVIPSGSESYTSEKRIFQRKNESSSFTELRANRHKAEFTTQEKRYPFLGWLGEAFGLFNFLPLLLTKFIIKTKVSQKIFSGSIKMAALILLFPLWFLLTFLVITMILGWKWALICLLIQLTSLIIRRELVRYNH